MNVNNKKYFTNNKERFSKLENYEKIVKELKKETGFKEIIFRPLDDFFFRNYICNEELLKYLINIIFQDKKYPKIDKIELLKERESKCENKTSKKIILDLQTVTDDGTLSNIEIQLTDHKDFAKKILYYGSDIVINSLNAGDDFEDLPNLVLINITDSNLDSTDNFHSTAHISYDKTYNHFTDLLRIHTLELPKFKNNTIIDLNNPLHRLMLFFDENTSSKTINLISEKDEFLKMMNTRLIENLKDTENLHKEFVERL